MSGGVVVRVLHTLQGHYVCIAFYIARWLVSRQLQCKVDSIRWFIAHPTSGCMIVLYYDQTSQDESISILPATKI